MSSWIRNLSRIGTYVDSVVNHAGQAAGGGTKLLRLSSQNEENYQHTIKRLEELSLSSRWDERTLLLREWLVSLQEAERIISGIADDVDADHDENDESSQPTSASYQDLDNEVEPLIFRDIFLLSKALEGIALSMIREAPNDEQVELILGIFGYCLIGGEQVHKAIVSSMQDLAIVFSCYQDEVLMKRVELLEFAQSSISGLKINAQQARIDLEVINLKTELSEKEIKIPPFEHHYKPSERPGDARTQVLKEAVSQVTIYSKLQELLVQNKAIRNGVSADAHAQKVDKLKILLESLANSTTKSEKRIEDHRSKQEQALSFHMAKVSEVSQVEKDLEAEMEALRRRREELEAELKENERSVQVHRSILGVNERLHRAKEERQQFDETNTDILQHFQFKEKELLQSIASSKIEASVTSAWISFVESTWRLQCIFRKQKEELINAELEKYAECFVNLSSQILSAYENEVSASINLFREYVEKPKDGSDDIPSSFDKGDVKSAKNWKMLEEDYHDMEAKLAPTFTVVENIRQLRAQTEEFCRKDDQNVDKLLDQLQKMKEDFYAIKRPNLQETATSSGWKSIMKKLRFKEAQRKLDQQEFNESNKYNQGSGIDHQQEFNKELATIEAESVEIVQGNATCELKDCQGQ